MSYQTSSGIARPLGKTVESVLSSHSIALVDEVKQDNIGVDIVQTLTGASLSTDTAIARSSVGVVSSVTVWNIGSKNIFVQEVVDDVHAAVSRGTRGTINAAVGERGIGHIVLGLEVVREFIVDVVHFSGVGAIV